MDIGNILKFLHECGISYTNVCFTDFPDGIGYYATVIPYERKRNRYCQLERNVIEGLYRIADADDLDVTIEYNSGDLFFTINSKSDELV